MGLASYFFTKNVDRTWRLLENLEAGMIGMNTGMFSLSTLGFPVELHLIKVATRQFLSSRIAVWRNQRVWLRKGIRKGCGHQ